LRQQASQRASQSGPLSALLSKENALKSIKKVQKKLLGVGLEPMTGGLEEKSCF